eukprot:gi/632986405/ref/XP_007910220.1/ PREDICTED: E3 ubiquitin-protein ligase RNF114-like [Callorhinchus milii]
MNCYLPQTMEYSGDFDCPVCLQILEIPIETKCGHIFCQACHQRNFRINRSCPICRGAIDLVEKHATSLDQQMRQQEGKCKGCDQQVYFSKMRDHMRNCAECKEEDIPLPSPQSDCLSASGSTYICPYCQETNFGEDNLLDHCIRCHFNDSLPVVCPVCVSMPWGDPNYFSRNFIGHLHLRHRFSYDYFVDYEGNEEVMFQHALLSSYQDFEDVEEEEEEEEEDDDGAALQMAIMASMQSQ